MTTTPCPARRTRRPSTPSSSAATGTASVPSRPGPFTCPIDVERLDALDDGDELRAVLRAAREL